MILTPAQAVEILKAPRNREKIESVKEQESQLRVFTDVMDRTELAKEKYWTRLLQTLEARSPKKWKRVSEFIRYPLPTPQITASILSDFFKVFDGKNRSFNVDGDRDLAALNRWINESDLEYWIEENAKVVFKSKVTAFIVVDKDTAGRPYLLLVDSSRLIDAEFKTAKGDLEYIAFVHSYVPGGIRYSVYDDAQYYVFEKLDGSDEYKLVNGDAETQTGQKHNIGYCPAVAFVSKPTNHENLFKREIAFTGALSKLEDFTVFDILRNYQDHFAPFPVTEAPKSKCSNDNCTDGVVKEEVLDSGNPLATPLYQYYECPACKVRGGDQIYPGTHIGIRVKNEANVKDGSGVFKMHWPDVDALQYTPDKLADLEVEIRHKTVGLNYMATMNEAMNKLQTKGSFASMESVLLNTKEELDLKYIWVVETCARIMYKQIAVKVDANYGTEFYLVTEDDLQKRFQAAKNAGLPIEEQLQIYLQIIETKYRGNPNKVERQKMILELDPMPLYTSDQVITMKEKNLIDAATLSMKINLLNFINRFESENLPITQFGIRLQWEKRIEAIKAELMRYNTELMAAVAKSIKEAQAQEPNKEVE